MSETLLPRSGNTKDLSFFQFFFNGDLCGRGALGFSVLWFLCSSRFTDFLFLVFGFRFSDLISDAVFGFPI